MELDKVLKHYNEKVKFFYECLSLFILADSGEDEINIDEKTKDQLIKTLEACKEVYRMTLEVEFLYQSVFNAYVKYYYGFSMIYVIDCLIYEVGDCYFSEGEEYEEN